MRTIHLIFKTHLDVGFTDFAAAVLDRYLHQYIPQAIATARQVNRPDEPKRFVWTTGSWLIYEYLEQAAPEMRAAMERAILDGEIVWHALPFTTHTELMDADLFRFGLSLSQELDRRFGRRTIAAKMTDVPGHSRGIVPLLAEAGVQFLHIGVNPASRPPDVPPVFRWRGPGGAEVIVMYHKGSYGDWMTVPGLEEAIAFAHTNDNLGPQSIAEVNHAYQKLEAAFPGRQVCASTLDAFARRSFANYCACAPVGIRRAGPRTDFTRVIGGSTLANIFVRLRWTAWITWLSFLQATCTWASDYIDISI